MNRKESSIQTVDNVELGLNTSKSSTNGKSNAVRDAVDSTEEKGDIEKTEREVETSVHETPIRFSKFLKLQKNSSFNFFYFQHSPPSMFKYGFFNFLESKMSIFITLHNRRMHNYL